jgi:hypothetical protein
VAMFLTGAAKIQDLRRAPKVLGPRLESWLRQRGVGC